MLGRAQGHTLLPATPSSTKMWELEIYPTRFLFPLSSPKKTGYGPIFCFRGGHVGLDTLFALVVLGGVFGTGFSQAGSMRICGCFRVARRSLRTNVCDNQTRLFFGNTRGKGAMTVKRPIEKEIETEEDGQRKRE